MGAIEDAVSAYSLDAFGGAAFWLQGASAQRDPTRAANVTVTAIADGADAVQVDGALPARLKATATGITADLDGLEGAVGTTGTLDLTYRGGGTVSALLLSFRNRRRHGPFGVDSADLEFLVLS